MTPNVNDRGIVDLGAIAQQHQQEQQAAAGLATWVTEVTTPAAFEDLLVKSMSHPVVVEFYSPRAHAQAMSDMLVRLADEAKGRYLLARVDVDTAREVAAALQVQAVPMVVGLAGGQLAPLWQGTTDEAQAKAFIEQLMQAAAAGGIIGRAEPVVAKRADGEPDPRFAAADAKLDAGDYAGAREEFAKVLDQFPGDAEAKAGLAQAGLLARLVGVDAQAVLNAVAAGGASLDEVFVAADVEVSMGRPEAAFARLVAAVRDHAGAERDAARTRLLELFDAVGNTDPSVLKARRDLAAALF